MYYAPVVFPLTWMRWRSSSKIPEMDGRQALLSHLHWTGSLQLTQQVWNKSTVWLLIIKHTVRSDLLWMYFVIWKQSFQFTLRLNRLPTYDSIQLQLKSTGHQSGLTHYWFQTQTHIYNFTMPMHIFNTTKPQNYIQPSETTSSMNKAET